LSSARSPVYQIKPTGFQPEIGRAARILEKIHCMPDEPIRGIPRGKAWDLLKISDAKPWDWLLRQWQCVVLLRA